MVAELPDGWSTVLSRQFQGGRDLSGGQWQRISVARGLYRDAPVVIADEPTAALDARAEHAVFAHAARARRQRARTGSPCSSRTGWPTSRHADQILVLERGRLIEHGRHEQLMARGGTYHELFSLQARAYADDDDDPDTVPA